MDSLKPQLPKISNEDRTPLVDVLLELHAWQQKQIDKLEQEILKLKGETTKPKIKPSKMDEDPAEDGNNNDKSKKNKGPKRSKTDHLKIDATVDIQPDKIPEGLTFKGYREVVIQDIVFKTYNTRYCLAQYQSPAGRYVSGQLPTELNGCHFGNDLISFILYQYHHQHVTQPLLLKQLQDLGVDISSGRLSQFITDGLDVFHDEKDQLLQTGLSVSQYIHTDDTGARHDGKNGYCTHIGNELFAWFNSTESKNLKGVVRIYQQTFVDTYSKVAFATLYTTKTPITAADLLNDKVLPYFEQDELPMLRILTDRGTEYCGRVEQHDYQLYLAINDIDHTKTKAMSPQTNGICERFHKTNFCHFKSIQGSL